MDTTLQILKSVDSFYRDAFSSLQTLTFSIMALVGLGLPILMRVYENYRMKLDRANLKDQFKTELKTSMAKMQTQFDELVKSEISKIQGQFKEDMIKLKEESDSIESQLRGGLYFLQGKQHAVQNHITLAAINYASAALASIKGHDDLNGKSAIAQLILYMTGLNQRDIASNEALRENITELIHYLNSVNQDGRFTDDINNITKGYEEAKTNTDG